MATEKRIHLDELEYTSEGFRSRESIDLDVGKHNKIVVVRPKRVRAVPVGYGSFGMDSAFPTPGVLMLGMRAALEDLFGWMTPGPATERYQVYGHAEPSGDEAHNKTLSDRRAAVVHALLAGNVGSLREVSSSEGWGTREHQCMLRVLRCDPGAIDGEPGPITEQATSMFQREYLEGVFHAYAELELAQPELATDGKLSGGTVDALLGAFVAATSPRIPPERFHPTHPIVGCSEFNLVDKERASLNRRIALVVHDSVPPFHDSAPCTEGDHSMCPIDNREELSSCLWYREHIVDPPPSDLIHRHFDLRWLALPNGKLLLSALTTLPDDDTVTFAVHRSKPIASADELSMDALGPTVGESVVGVIRHGIAQVVWVPPEDFDIDNPRGWMVPIPADDIAAARTAKQRSRIPVFVVRGGGVEALSPPPGRELGRIPTRPINSERAAEAGVVGLDAFGHLYRRSAVHEREPAQMHPLRDAETRVLRVRYADRVLKPGAPS